MRVENNKIIGEIGTEELVWLLRGYAVSMRSAGNELGANIITLAADRLAELEESHGVCDR